jgi:GAG-pre-integrase domain
MRSEYIRRVTSDAMLEQARLLTERNGEAWMTEEWKDCIVGSHFAGADALELLHIRLGHMPYQRIKRMKRRQIIKGYKLDSKTLKALLREKCDVCICSKKADASHKGQLPLPMTAWVNFSTDLSAHSIDHHCTLIYIKWLLLIINLNMCGITTCKRNIRHTTR